jgi:hypothetical protein
VEVPLCDCVGVMQMCVFRSCFVRSFRLGFGCASFGWLRLQYCGIAVRWSFIRSPLLLDFCLHSNSHVLPMRFGAHIHTTMQILIIAKNSRLTELELEPHPRTNQQPPNQIPSPPILHIHLPCISPGEMYLLSISWEAER